MNCTLYLKHLYMELNSCMIFNIYLQIPKSVKIWHILDLEKFYSFWHFERLFNLDHFKVTSFLSSHGDSFDKIEHLIVAEVALYVRQRGYHDLEVSSPSRICLFNCYPSWWIHVIKIGFHPTSYHKHWY